MINHADHHRLPYVRFFFIKEAWTLIYDLKASGLTPAEWTEKSIKVKGGEKNAGRIAVAGQPQKAAEPHINIYPKSCKVVTIEAESGEEAAEALRKFYGEGIVDNVALAAKASSVAEVKHQ
jgi:hypothetical protein